MPGAVNTATIATIAAGSVATLVSRMIRPSALTMQMLVSSRETSSPAYCYSMSAPPAQCQSQPLSSSSSIGMKVNLSRSNLAAISARLPHLCPFGEGRLIGSGGLIQGITINDDGQYHAVFPGGGNVTLNRALCRHYICYLCSGAVIVRDRRTSARRGRSAFSRLYKNS